MTRPAPQECANRTSGASPSIRRVALLSLAVGCAYTLLVAVSLTWTDSWLGMAVGQWMRFTDSGVAALLFFLPDPQSTVRSELIVNVTTYRHVLIVCVLVTIASALALRRHWTSEGRRLVRILRFAETPSRHFPNKLYTVYCTAIIGSAAITYLLLLEGREATPLCCSSMEIYSHFSALQFCWPRSAISPVTPLR